MDEIERLRTFNRFYLRELGLLGRSYLGSGLGVTEVRVLWELAHGDRATARTLAAWLALDEGYLSRVLKGFERRGWLARVPDRRDGRRRLLTLTEAGRSALAPLEAASRADVAERLAPLSDGALARLMSGIDNVRAALGAKDQAADVSFRDLAPGDAGWVTARHGKLYRDSDGYDVRFEALVAGILSEFIVDRIEGRERAWIAARNGRRLGAIFCMQEDSETARLRIFFVEPEARGLGLGRRMLALCMAFARDAGYCRMVLWTHASHRAACALYAEAGWRMTRETPTQAFGQEVVDQIWEVAL